MAKKPDIDGLMNYCYGSAEDKTTLEICLEAAENWLDAAGVPKWAQEGGEYTLAVYQLATYYYENRGAVSTEMPLIPPPVFSAMHQLRTTPMPEGWDAGD